MEGKKTRNSSFELLRVLLMFMILVEHVNLWFISSQYADETEHAIRCLVQSICLPAVNAFVLISGWFGINGGNKRLYPLLFQFTTCTLPTVVVCLFLGLVSFHSLDDVFIYIVGGANYWFVIDYIALVMFAPLLNIMANHIDQKVLKTFLIAFYTLIVPMDVILRTDILGTEGGYSALWFIWLYLLAMYIRLYGWEFVEKNKWMLLIGSIVLETVLFYFGLQGTRYTNPFVLMPAICMILIFKKWTFHNIIINYIAPATLITYMLHMQPCYVSYIRKFLGGLYNANGYYIYMIEALGLIILLCMVSIFVYRIQLLLWKLFCNLFYKYV